MASKNGFLSTVMNSTPAALSFSSLAEDLASHSARSSICASRATFFTSVCCSAVSLFQVVLDITTGSGRIRWPVRV
ncbi:hypothetical protein D3C77_790680 [compost metagenome]